MDIKQARESKNMTQEQLARELDISRSTVAMWETQKITPRASMLLRLSKLFDCSIDELIRVEAKESEESGTVA